MNINLRAALASIATLGFATSALATSFNAVHQFPGGGDGLLPYGGLVDVGGVLYGTTEQGGAAGRGAIFAVNAKTGAETLVYSFKIDTDAASPQAGLIRVGKLLYGTTAYGGTSNEGTVFSVDPATGAERVIYSFNATSGNYTNTPLTYASGYLYGETWNGGANNLGTVFKLDMKTDAETTLYSFKGGNDGCLGGYGALVQVGTLLYGTAISCGAAGDGVLFSVDPSTGAETVVHSFAGTDGNQPLGGVVAMGTTLFGATAFGGANGDGTIYQVDAKTSAESVLYNFTGGADGATPQATLAYVSGTLYGTAAGGGSGYGTVFGVNAASGAQTTLYSFAGGADGGKSQTPVIAVSGMLYGTSLGPEQIGANAGTVFAVSIKKKAESTLHDFIGPHPFFQSNSALLPVGNLLYGITENTGPADEGTIYQLDPADGTTTTLFSFSGSANGAAPYGGVTSIGSVIYGVTNYGGTANDGAVFAYDTTSGAEITLHMFSGADGANPTGGLLFYDNLLYGATLRGGTNNVGTLFSIDPATGTLTTLYDFTPGGDGYEPAGGLIEHAGILYGTTQFGGPSYAGNVFAFKPKSRALAVLYNFTGGTDGYLPQQGVTYVGGELYGTTVYGGSCGSNCGVIFAVNAKTGAQQVVHSFSGVDGLLPSSPLSYDGKALYGATYDGGDSGAGNIFELVVKSGAVSTLYSFTGGEDGWAPAAALLNQGGTFISTTNTGGTYGAGTIFTLTP